MVGDDGSVVRTLKVGRSRLLGDPVISPDGRRVAYWSTRKKGRAGGAIYTLAMDGSSGPRRLTPDLAGRDADPAWSPDGTQLAFRRRTATAREDVFVMRADGGDARRVVGGRRTEQKPVWSPDGTRLLFVSDRRAKRVGASSDLYVIGTNGRGLRALGVTSTVISTPAWRFR